MCLFNTPSPFPNPCFDWINMSEQEPPDVVEDYWTENKCGETKILEWYHGDCFMYTTGGHWCDEDGNEVCDIVRWKRI